MTLNHKPWGWEIKKLYELRLLRYRLKEDAENFIEEQGTMNGLKGYMKKEDCGKALTERNADGWALNFKALDIWECCKEGNIDGKTLRYNKKKTVLRPCVVADMSFK